MRTCKKHGDEEAGKPQSVDDYGDDYGLRRDAAQSSTVVVAEIQKGNTKMNRFDIAPFAMPNGQVCVGKV